MCNLYSCELPPAAMAKLREMLRHLPTYPDTLPDPGPRYAVRPRTRAPIVRLDGDAPIWSMALWFFLPPGAKEPPRMQLTNARDDKLVSGWPWKLVSKRQRCLVLATGFCEPEKPAMAKGTVPWRFYSMTDRSPFFMAGLWSEAVDPKTGELVDTYTIVTTEANSVVHIHNRMPVILDPADHERWLTPGDVPTDLLRPYPADRMQGWRVGDAIKSSRSPDSPRLLEPVPDTPAQGTLI